MKYLAVAAVMSMMAGSVVAAPSVAKVGECTNFQNDNMASKSTCSVAIDHTPQTKTTTLKTAAASHTVTVNHGGKDYAKPTFSLDGVVAEHYLRDANTNKRITLSQAESSNANVLNCYKTEKENICHS